MKECSCRVTEVAISVNSTRRKWRSRCPAAVMACATAMWLGSLQPLSAQSGHCDPDVEVSPTAGLAYKERGDRCEGIYVEKVSGALSVASFTMSYMNYRLDGPSLSVEWASPSPAAVRLRARSFRPKVYYRMDSQRPEGSTSFNWPLDILGSRNLKLGKGQLGVVGWYQDPQDSRRKVYLPLRISQEGSAAPRRYNLKVYTERSLDEVYLSIAAIGPDGRAGRYVKDEIPLEYGYYPARRPFEVPLGGLEKGIYLVQLGAQLENGGTVNLEFWIYVPGP